MKDYLGIWTETEEKPGAVVACSLHSGVLKPVRKKFSIPHTRPDRPWGPPSLLYNGYRVFPRGVKRPGRGVDHLLPSSDEVNISGVIPLLHI